MTAIKPFRNTVMFEFLDSSGGAKGRFTPRATNSGIILVASVTEQKKHRWGRVLAAGPTSQVKEGDLVLIESLMWMEGNVVDGIKMWKTDDSKILMVAGSEDLCEAQ